MTTEGPTPTRAAIGAAAVVGATAWGTTLAILLARNGLRVTLLSDPDRKVMQEYGAWGDKKLYGKTTVGVIRSTVLIDGAGKVAHHWRSVRAAGHAGKVREKLEALRGGA